MIKHKNKSFTLVELLVVIAIIGLLASIILVALGNVRDKAKIARVQADLNVIRSAMYLLLHDTYQHPDHIGLDLNCSPEGGPEEYLNTCTAGLECTDGGFPNWQGPYMPDVPTDPWGNNYIFDADFRCNTGVKGCERLLDNTNTRSIHSGGPNGSGINEYDNDNIVLVICIY